MNLKPRRQEAPDVNLTPLVDVVLLLLIFFMVSTTFREETDLEILLPEASRQVQPESSEDQIMIAIDAAGNVFLNGQSLVDGSLAAIEAALAAAAGKRRDLPLVIRADGRTSHQAVVRAMDAAARMGFRRLGIATLEAGPAEGGKGDPGP